MAAEQVGQQQSRPGVCTCALRRRAACAGVALVGGGGRRPGVNAGLVMPTSTDSSAAVCTPWLAPGMQVVAAACTHSQCPAAPPQRRPCEARARPQGSRRARWLLWLLTARPTGGGERRRRRQARRCQPYCPAEAGCRSPCVSHIAAPLQEWAPRARNVLGAEKGVAGPPFWRAEKRTDREPVESHRLACASPRRTAKRPTALALALRRVGVSSSVLPGGEPGIAGGNPVLTV